MKEIARLFGVSVEYLLGKEQKAEEEKRDFSAETELKPEEERLESKKESVKIWDDKERLKKILLTYLLIIVGIPATMLAPLGILFCIYAFGMSRRWKINSLWLDFILFVYLAVSVYRMYILASGWIYDFPRSTFRFR